MPRLQFCCGSLCICAVGCVRFNAYLLLYLEIVGTIANDSFISAGIGWFFFVIGIVHKFVGLSLGPSIIILLSFIIVILCLQNTHMQPASHRTGTDSKFLSFMSGHM